MTTWSSDIWAGAEFRARLLDFVRPVVGEPQRLELVSHRPWSAVWRVQAEGGASYAKQNCPGQSHEAYLMRALTLLAEDYVVPVLAADAEHDLLLTADLGPTLDERAGSADVDRWCAIVGRSADLQRRTQAAADDLGLTAMRPGEASTYVADAIGRLGALPVDDPRHLEVADARRLADLLPAVDRWSDRVDDLCLPLALVHNDLHPGNVVGPDGDLRFLDFGDAVIGDPLANLLVPLDTAARELSAAPDDRRLRRIADAGLEPWSDLASPNELRAALPASLQLARLARVESWRRCVATMTPAERKEYGGAPAGWLVSLLAPAPVGVT
ncbi:phosphotransferase family protein [Nocardioides caeni]|uniref:Aminoglycoside phosphotransferase family protein n=1 Tax=Nocardioides caeni TaxID=574700 RepID=A0A4S8MZ92_9ACTN|nr:aminoglycoside phosphotransferase family protein [Nocardioides caeni]THV08797.1 aminoglycoside phosphotransferase family protein [Nocardioides caeni]